MPRIKEGFKGERAIVLPAFLIEELKQDPLGSELYITDIGYYPHACSLPETQHRGSNRVYPYLLYGGRRVV